MTGELYSRKRPSKPELTDELLSAYIDGELSAQERARVDTVLARSAADRENLELMQQTLHLLHELPRVPLPRAFTLSEAQVGIRREPGRSWRLFTLLRSVTVAATMLFAVLLGGDYYLRTLAVPGTPSSPSSVAFAPSDTTTAQAPAPAEREALPPTDIPPTSLAEPADGGAPPPATERGFSMTAPTVQPPAAKQSPTREPLLTAPLAEGSSGDRGGADGPGMGMGSGSGDSGGAGSGEFGPGGEPIPSIVPLDATPPTGMMQAAPQVAGEPTPTPMPTPSPTPAAELAMSAEDTNPSPQEPSQPTLPEAQEGGTLGQLRQLRDRWQQSLLIVEIVLAALVVSLVMALWLVRRRTA